MALFRTPILLEVAVELAKKDRPSSRPLPVRERILAAVGRALLKLVGKKQNAKLKAIIRRQNASWRLLKQDHAGHQQRL
ncbi:hypothetical protein ACLB1S_21450 [Escherichia coli]